VLTPTLEQVRTDGADEVAAGFPPPRLVLTEEERRALEASETQCLQIPV